MNHTVPVFKPIKLSKMGSPFFTVSAFLAMVFLSSFCAITCHGDGALPEFFENKGSEGGSEKEGYDLELREPEEELHYEGGSIRIWRKDVRAFPDTRMDVSEITFKEDGLMLPQYADSDGISCVLEGTGKLGVVSPFQGGPPHLSIRRVERGDVIAIPRGVVFWWYNDGYGNHRIFCASDTSKGVNPGLYHQFSLAGAKMERFGGLLHGFSRETLASAWGVDEEMVASFLESQNETTMIKSPRRIRLPDPRGQRMDIHTSNTVTEEKPPGYLGFSEFRYNLDKGYPDIYVKRGGWMKVANENNLPLLELVGMSAMKVGLSRSAIEAPVFFPNAHQIVYITRGSGRIEVSSNDGESILAVEVQEGSMIVIPKFLPSIKVAGDEGLSFLSFLTSSRPLPSYLVGRNSFYEGVPQQVLAASFNVDEEILSSVRESRKHQEIIFPPSTAYT